MKKVLIFGYYGFNNIGDDAILYVLVSFLKRISNELTITVNSHQVYEDSLYQDVQFVNCENLDQIVTEIEINDYVIVGGGGLFHDHWQSQSWNQGLDFLITDGQKGFTLFAGIPVLAKLLNKPSLLYALGVGPINSVTAEKMVQLACESASKVSVRDIDSENLLTKLKLDANLGFDTQRIFDPVLALDDVMDLSNTKSEYSQKVIVFCLRAWDGDELPKKWLEDINSLIEKLHNENYKIQLLPFQTGGENNDLELANDIKMNNPIGNHLDIIKCESLTDYTTCIKQADCLVAMRLHAAIISYVVDVPFVTLGYSEKMHNFVESTIEYDDYFDAQNWDAQKLYSAIDVKLNRASDFKTSKKQFNVDLHIKVLSEFLQIKSNSKNSALLDRFILTKFKRQNDLHNQLVISQSEHSSLVKKFGKMKNANDELADENKTFADKNNELVDLYKDLSDRYTELSGQVINLAAMKRKRLVVKVKEICQKIISSKF